MKKIILLIMIFFTLGCQKDNNKYLGLWIDNDSRSYFLITEKIGELSFLENFELISRKKEKTFLIKEFKDIYSETPILVNKYIGKETKSSKSDSSSGSKDKKIYLGEVYSKNEKISDFLLHGNNEKITFKNFQAVKQVYIPNKIKKYM